MTWLAVENMRRSKAALKTLIYITGRIERLPDDVRDDATLRAVRAEIRELSASIKREEHGLRVGRDPYAPRLVQEVAMAQEQRGRS